MVVVDDDEMYSGGWLGEPVSPRRRLRRAICSHMALLALTHTHIHPSVPISNVCLGFWKAIAEDAHARADALTHHPTCV